MDAIKESKSKQIVLCPRKILKDTHKGVMLCDVFTFQAFKSHRPEKETTNNF